MKPIVMENSEMGLLAAFQAEIRCVVIPDLKQPSEENKPRNMLF
jgi:hypothetical protein